MDPQVVSDIDVNMSVTDNGDTVHCDGIQLVSTKANLPIDKYLEIAKDGKSSSYIQLSTSGLFAFTASDHNRVHIQVFLGQSVFDVSGSQETAVSGMFVVADILKRMSPSRAGRITKYVSIKYTPGHHYIVLSILDQNKDTLTSTQFTPRPATESMVPTRSHKHDVMLELSSQDLLLALEGMPPVFSIRVDHDSRQIEFKGTGQFETTTVCNIPLSEASCIELKKYPDICHYEERFSRQSVMSLIRTCRLTQSVYMGVTQNLPAVFHAYLSEEHPLAMQEPRSHIQMTIFPHIDTVAKLHSSKNPRKRVLQECVGS